MTAPSPTDAGSMAGVRHTYVHVPFCARRCTYCDFSIAVRRQVPAVAFARSVEREMEVRALPAVALDTLYFGGGTPSRLGADGVAALMASLARRVTLTPGAEVTLEVNPEDVTEAAARAWAVAGITRVSLGVQSFDPRVLAWMHRGHDAALVRRAVDVLRGAGIDNLSLDLIYAVPKALERDWPRDVDLALALEPQHLSCYGLTVEPHTPLGRHVARGVALPAPEEAHEHEFLLGHATLTGAGFAHYEVSNYARPGFRSRHNSAYWDGRAYLGVGPAAHGFDGRKRRWNAAALTAWERHLGAGRDPVEGEETLSGEQERLERTYLDLRSDRGALIVTGDEPIIHRWIEAGWAARHDDRLRLTPPGWLRLDALVAALTEHRSRY